METWFNLPNLKTIEAPPKWKMAIVSFIAAYSISLVAHSVLSIYLGQRPLLTEILMTIILVVGLTYFAMPLLSKIAATLVVPKERVIFFAITTMNR